MEQIRILGGFHCPHCTEINLCDCKTCKPFYEKNGIGDKKYCTWTEDGDGFICSYCGVPFSPDESLEEEYRIYMEKNPRT